MGTFQHIQRENVQQPQTLIQPSLEIGKEDDEHEKEANHVADKIMKMSEPEDKKKKMKDAGTGFQKMTAGAEEGKIKRMVDSPLSVRKMSDGNTGALVASPQVEQGISNSKGNGQPLPADTQQELEGKIGADFSDVKIHTDNNAMQMNKEVGAKAFTHGNDVYFNQGQYNPSSSQGKHLLAHELTHTVQQGNQKIQRQQDNKAKNDEKKVHDSSKDGNKDYAVSWYAPFGQRIAQWGYNTNWQYTNLDKKTIKSYLGPFRRDALDNGLFSAVQGLLTELILKRVGLEGMKSRAAGAGVAIATGAAGLEIKERIRSKTIDTYRWYGRYRYHYSNDQVLAVDYWGKGPIEKQLVDPVYLDQCIMNADGEILYTYTCELGLLGVDPNTANLIPDHSYGKVDV